MQRVKSFFLYLTTMCPLMTCSCRESKQQICKYVQIFSKLLRVLKGWKIADPLALLDISHSQPLLQVSYIIILLTILLIMCTATDILQFRETCAKSRTYHVTGDHRICIHCLAFPFLLKSLLHHHCILPDLWVNYQKRWWQLCNIQFKQLKTIVFTKSNVTMLKENGKY